MRREKRYYVYILASKNRALYTGVTGSLMARVLQHKSGECDGSPTGTRSTVWFTTKFFST
ncbi:MAG: GIY-YIG nuclease family protein [Terriglobales bacterium]